MTDFERGTKRIGMSQETQMNEMIEQLHQQDESGRIITSDRERDIRKNERGRVLDEIDTLECKNCKDYHKPGCPLWCGRTVNACTDHSRIAQLRQQVQP
jgi:hypothetical protein